MYRLVSLRCRDSPGASPGHPGDRAVQLAGAVDVIQVAAGDACRVADAVQKREDMEGEKRAKLASGILGLDMYGRREPLAKAGLMYID